ncbi:MAG: cobalamin-dependent protein, partial [Patescibacteria group bacterium]
MVKDTCDLKIFDCLVTDFEIRKSNSFTVYGTPSEKIKNTITDFKPDILGISIPFSTQIDSAIDICNICKDASPDTIVVFGGPHASVRYKSLLEETACDFCVIGEGEKTFYEFVKNYNSKLPLKDIEGLAYKMDGEIHFKPRKFLEDLDELPFPAYETINMDSYLNNKYLYGQRSSLSNSISMITSRGCPYSCIFCSIKLHMGRKYRFHSPGYVLRHIKFLMENYGISNFHFEDDNISLDKHRFEQILDGIITGSLNIKWDTPNGVRADTLDGNLLKKIKRSGCEEITLGIESGNQYVVNSIIKKNISLDYMLFIIKQCKALKLKVNAFYVIGFPQETIENMKETISLALDMYKRYDVLPVMHIATPLYGTELYNICIENKLIKENLTAKDFSMATQILGEPLISSTTFKREDIKKLARNYLLRLYLFRFQKEFLAYMFKHPLATF